jgi:hypothetical protein
LWPRNAVWRWDVRNFAWQRFFVRSGKTFTAANVCYRLVKHADARRILFLVDRANLGRQTLKVPGVHDAWRSPQVQLLYNVQHLSSNKVDPVARVAISTIQRVYSILRGDPALDPEADVAVDPEAGLTSVRRLWDGQWVETAAEGRDPQCQPSIESEWGRFPGHRRCRSWSSKAL